MNFVLGQFLFQCPVCKERAAVQRRTPSETVLNPSRQPKGIQPVPFVCIPSGQFVETVPDFDDAVISESNPAVALKRLWRIDFECAHENCKRPCTVLAIYDKDGHDEDLIALVLRANPRLACGSNHDAVLDWENTKANYFLID